MQFREINVIPYPTRVERKNGCFLLPDDGNIISYVTKKKTAVYTNPESYGLEVTPLGFIICAGGEQGFFRGWQTLKQLVKTTKDGRVPCCMIEDEPRFPYRAFMLDSARHMQSVDEIKTMIDAAAFFKFNVFHWHISDDQGYRAESTAFPLLNTVGSYRDSSDFGNLRDTGRYGGWYTKAEMLDIVDYCRKRFITVVPEIDMPGHVTAILASYPHLSCSGEQYRVRTTGGIFPEILCAGKQTTFDFIFALLDELCEIFDGEYFHIGGDEAPKKNWIECPDCRAALEREGLESPEQLQGWFASRIAGYLKTKGKKTIVWNESLAGGMLSAEITAQKWMDKPGLSIEHAKAGGALIISDFFHYYMDYPYGMTPLNKVYRYEPVPQELDVNSAQNVMGVDCPIWTEYIDNAERLHYLAYPRFMAVAESAWTIAENKSVGSFRSRAKALLPLLKSIGVTAAVPYEWNPLPVRRAENTLRFFVRSINRKTVKSFLDSRRD